MTGDIVTTLATSGATTIVAAAATDAWKQTKQGFARLLGRGNSAAVAEAETALERTSTALSAQAGADLEATRHEQRLHWEALLLHLLRDYPDARAELEQLLAETGVGPAVTITATAHDSARQAVQGSGTQNITFS